MSFDELRCMSMSDFYRFVEAYLDDSGKESDGGVREATQEDIDAFMSV